MNWAPVAELEADEGTQEEALVILEPSTIMWKKGSAVLRRWIVPGRVRYAVVASFRGLEGRYAAVVGNDAVRIYGLTPGAAEDAITGLPFVPDSAWGTERGLVMATSDGAELQLCILSSPFTLTGSMVPASLGTFRGKPIWFNADFAVFYDKTSKRVDIHVVRYLDLQLASAPLGSRNRRSILAGLSSTAGLSGLASDTTVGIDPLPVDERAAVLSIEASFVLSEESTAQELKVIFQRSPEGTVFAILDTSTRQLYVLDSQRALTVYDDINMIVPLSGLDTFPLVATNDTLWSLFRPEFAPLQLPGTVVSSNGNCFRTLHSRFVLAITMDELTSLGFALIQYCGGPAMVALWLRTWLAAQAEGASSWEAFSRVPWEIQRGFPRDFGLLAALLREDCALAAHKQADVARLDAFLDAAGLSMDSLSIFEALVAALDGVHLWQLRVEIPQALDHIFWRLRAIRAVVSVMSGGASASAMREALAQFDLPRRADEFAPGVRLIIREISAFVGPRTTLMSTLSMYDVVRLLWPEDRRWAEAEKLLQVAKPQVAHLEAPVNASEHDLARLQSDLAIAVAARVPAAAFGRAGMALASVPPAVMAPIRPETMCFDVMLAVSGATVPAPRPEAMPALSWGEFAHGAAAGLSVGSSASEVPRNWIALHVKPGSDVDAGMLWGLGLMGHLKNLEEWHVYKYLDCKHPQTSIGTLLGLSASRRGSADPKLTRLLSVHVRALLPAGAQLPVSQRVEDTATVALGLLYHRTSHRRMTRLMLREMKSSGDGQPSEAAALAAALALGMIGCKDESLGLLKLVNTTGDKANDPPTLATSPATLALLLTFAGTRHRAVVDALQMPKSVEAAQYFRPDELFSRGIAQVLVDWPETEVTVTREALEARIPAGLRPLHRAIEADPDDLAYAYALSGVAVGVALRYAGTRSSALVHVLLELVDDLADAPRPYRDRWHDKYAVRSLFTLQCAVTMAAAAVEVSSGSVPVLQRVLRLWEVFPDSKNAASNPNSSSASKSAYHVRAPGDYEMLATAIGWLFLGGGRWAWKPGPEAAAHLALAWLPLLGGGAGVDGSEWQHMRLLWVIAAEPRCIAVRDAGTSRVVEGVKLQIRFVDQARPPLEVIAPAIVPPLDEIAHIQVVDSRFVHETTQGLEVLVHPKVRSSDIAAPTKPDGQILRRMALKPRTTEDLWNLRLVFSFVDSWRTSDNDPDLKVLRSEVDVLKALVWKASQVSQV